jgi:hypothetical protein
LGPTAATPSVFDWSFDLVIFIFLSESQSYSVAAAQVGRCAAF